MADLGSVGFNNSPLGTRITATQQAGGVYQRGREVNYQISANKTISGTVEEGGVGVARTVCAYRRSTGELLSSTTSAGDGTFSLSVPVTDACFVVAFDDLGTSPNFNALVYDQITPG